MDINGQTIVTPYDNPADFNPGWRHAVAIALSVKPNLFIPEAAVRKDPYIRRHAQYLRLVDTKSRAATAGKFESNRVALTWAQGDSGTKVRDYLEPLLLTDATFKAIAADLHTDMAAVMCYERLFYACRDVDGQPLSANMLMAGWINSANDRNTYDQNWKYFALRAGYPFLVRKWGWKNPHGLTTSMWQRHMDSVALAQEEFIDKLIQGRVDASTLAMYVRSYHEGENRTDKDDTNKQLALLVVHMLQRTLSTQTRTVMERRAAIAEAASTGDYSRAEELLKNPATAQLQLSSSAEVDKMLDARVAQAQENEKRMLNS